MKKIFSILLSCVLLGSMAVGLVACDDGKRNSDEPITITDMAGRKVSFEKTPDRIISISPGVTESIYGLGLENYLIACTNYCDYPVDAKDKDKIGGTTLSSMNIEKVIEIVGDKVGSTAIIASGSTGFSATSAGYHLATEYGFKVVYLDITSFESLFESFKLINDVMNGGKDINKVIDGLQKRVDAVTKKIKNDIDRPTVIHIMYSGLQMAGGNTITSQIIEMAGGKNLGADFGTGYPKPDVEAFIVANPDFIVCVTSHGSGYGYRGDVVDDPRLQGMDALKDADNCVLEIDANATSRFGPRLVDALEDYAKILHPEIFGDYEFDPNEYAK